MNAPSKPCRIEMFGELRITLGETTTSRFLTRKISGLLAYLALKMPRMQPRELLCELFWPDQEIAAARNSLSVALSSLRRHLDAMPRVGSGGSG
ncbi:MAG: winged helix-turn-helix domain-containing protein [Cytophagales bacterium]|nr:winged helix-turn-helix domain-containing protein [Armatimonadota bacterium]